jgi:hypothetical protein
MELFEESSGLRGPPKATLARRAKSYSDFYGVAVEYLSKEAKPDKPRDVFELSMKSSSVLLEKSFEDFEDDLLDESHEEFQQVPAVV